MQHFGIFFNNSERWLTNDSGMIFSTACKHVAKAQLKMLKETHPKTAATVKEFTADNAPKQKPEGNHTAQTFSGQRNL